jgi:hydrogenase large subunit
MPIQTGALAEALALKDSLITSLYKLYGDCSYVRELARILRGVRYLQWMIDDIDGIINNIKEPIYVKPKKIKNAKGSGLTHASRGVLGHWLEIENYKIKSYQIISPTTWNGSPMDSKNQMGAWEKALIGVNVKDIKNPIEMGHIIRSFDPCLVCSVHFLQEDYRYKFSL